MIGPYRLQYVTFSMTKDDSLHSLTASERGAELGAAAARCVKCGRCLSVCPVYRETGNEAQAARGKLALIETAASGTELLSEERMKDLLCCCLLCGACTETCPNLVAADRIIREGRAQFLSSRNPPRALRLALAHLLPFPHRMDRLHQAGKLLQPMLLKKVPRESGLHLRFPGGAAFSSRLIPAPAKQPFLKAYEPMNIEAGTGAHLFVGCVANYLFPEIARSMAEIFQHLETPVVVPPEQGCCGLVAYGAGNKEVARRVAARNIEAFAGTGPIVAFCSSCSSHLKDYPDLFDDRAEKEEARRFSSRVKDASEFLVEQGLLGKATLKTEPLARMTFHDPCHLRRKQGIVRAPRELLSAIEGGAYIETGHEQLCCGSGGSFNLSHYDVSLNIFKRRLAPIREAGVDTVVTSCMGCLLQFMDGLYQEGVDIRAQHLVEVLRNALSETT